MTSAAMETSVTSSLLMTLSQSIPAQVPRGTLHPHIHTIPAQFIVLTETHSLLQVPNKALHFELFLLGVISVRNPASLDRETTPTIPLLLIARDQGSNPLGSTLEIFVDLDDINDNSPIFSPASYFASVPEVRMHMLSYYGSLC